MDARDGSKFPALMGFHLLWGFVLWFSISRLGLGVSTDSVHLLFGAQNLAETGRLVSFDGSPLILWPPLYPVLLAGIHLGTGLSTFAAAHILQAAAFLGVSVCLSLLFLNIFPENFALALAGNLLADIGIVVVQGFDLVGSDYVHLFLSILCALLAAIYIKGHSSKTYVALASVAMLAMLERYVGIAGIAMGVATVLFLAAGSLRQRLVRGFFLSLSVLPATVWYLRTAPLVDRRPPISFAENFHWFSRSILEWFLPDSALKVHLTVYIVLLWALIGGLVVLLVWIGRRRISAFAQPILLFGLFYLLALFGSASIAYYNKLAGRFLLPIYVPFIVLLLVSVNAVPEAARSRSAGRGRAATMSAVAVLVLAVILLLRSSLPYILESHWGASGIGENAFNTAEWRANAAIRFWLDHPPGGRYQLLSNYPDAVAFYTGHACDPSPRQFSGPYGTVDFPVEGYAASLFASGREVYILWIEPNDYGYYYKPQDLEPIADIRELFGSGDGGVYLLRPKTGD